jgi:hypothetical protein
MRKKPSFLEFFDQHPGVDHDLAAPVVAERVDRC